MNCEHYGSFNLTQFGHKVKVVIFLKGHDGIQGQNRNECEGYELWTTFTTLNSS